MANAVRRFADDRAAEQDRLSALAPVPSVPESESLTWAGADARSQALTEKAYRALHIGFVALPLVAGVDKFANGIADWSQYIAPVIPEALGVSVSAIVMALGVFEVILAIGLVLKARLFADIFSAYLVLTIANFVLMGAHFDAALVNFALAAGACALARLAQAREHGLQLRHRDETGGTPPTRGVSYLD